jgi:hypothetical protein
MRRMFAVMTVVVVTFAALAASVAVAQERDGGARGVVARPQTPFPSMRIARIARGEDAIALLGKRLPEIATWHGMSAERMQGILRNDRTAHVDVTGRLHFVEETPGSSVPSGASAPSAAVQLQPLNQTFLLHSRPNASRVMYLNFVGGPLVDTIWNARAANFRGTVALTAHPFSLDGTNSFSTAELEMIQRIWQRVSEDFAPFDVDVTTQAPSEADITRAPRGPTDKFGTTALITRRTFEGGCGCAGIAYLSAFDDFDNYYKPALVFFDIANYSEKNIAEVISHELGHNIGLSHDGALGGVEYYAGHGAGPTGWAPIMGSGYSRELVQWSNGSYANANNQQADYRVMFQTGLGSVADDHGNGFANARALSPASPGTSQSLAGVIADVQSLTGGQTDVDMFYTTATGQVTVQVTPAALSPNLDVLVSVYASNGALIASANPQGTLDATVTFPMYAPGLVYISVQGTGNADPAGGYPVYGSVGRYQLSVSSASL